MTQSPIHIDSRLTALNTIRRLAQYATADQPPEIELLLWDLAHAAKLSGKDLPQLQRGLLAAWKQIKDLGDGDGE